MQTQRARLPKACQLVGRRLLTGRDDETDKASQSTHGQVDLGAQAATRASDSADLEPPYLRRCSAGSADNCGFDNQVLEIGVIRHGLKDTLPNTFLAPAAEPPKDTVLLAEDFRQVAPGQPRTRVRRRCRDPCVSARPSPKHRDWAHRAPGSLLYFV